MHIAVIAAALALAPQNPGDLTRDIVMDVCLPFAADGAAQPAAIEANGLSGPEAEAGRDLKTSNEHYLVKLEASGSAEYRDIERVCTVSARVGGFQQARNAIGEPLEAAGFVLKPGEPADWPIWTRGGVEVSLHQNPGRATIIRVGYSDFDAGL